MMKCIGALGICLLIVLPRACGQGSKRESTIIGDVVDITGYVSYGMKADTPDRKAAAATSAKAGNPLGILEQKTGKVFIVAMAQESENANGRLLGYLGLHVYAKGVVHRKGGVQLIVLNDIGKSIR